MSHFFYSLLKFCLGLIFVVTGLGALLLPWSPHARTFVVNWILQGSMEIVIFGIGFCVIGIYLVAYSLLHARNRYYRIYSDDPNVKIHPSIVQDYLSSYWKSLFPLSEIPCRLEMNPKKIQVHADLPFMPLDDQKDLLQKIEKDLSDLFRGMFGYRHRLDILISFAKQKNT